MSDYTIIMRNILEVRLKEKQFAFLDYRGKFIDFLTENYKGEKIKYLNNGGRIDIATKDLKEVFFFGVENFGFQMEAVKDFGLFKSQIEKIFRIIKEFDEYKFKNIVRIGVKSFIYCHKKGKGFEAVRDNYKNKMFKDCGVYEKISTSKIVDFGYLFNDVEINDSKASVMTGPVKESEAILKFFNDPEDYADAKKAGFMYIIDCFVNDPKEKSTNEELKSIALKNVENIEKSFNGFKDFIFEEEKEENKNN